MHQRRKVSSAGPNGICRSHNFSPSRKQVTVLPTRPIVRREHHPWTSTEEEILISLCKERGSKLKGSGSSQKWQEIADEPNTLSEEVNTSSMIKTGTQCKDKWRNLLTAYKKAKDSSTKSGNGTEKMKAFKLFDQMDKFMSDKHEII